MDALNFGVKGHPHYARLRHLCLALKPELKHSDHDASDGSWVVLSVPGADSHYRCRPRVFEWLGRVDGHCTLDELLAMLNPGAEQAQGLRVLYALFLAGFLTESPAAAGAASPWYKRLSAPLMQRFGVQPSAALTSALEWLAARVVHRWTGYIGGLFVAWGLIFAIGQHAQLTAHWESRFLDPSSLVLLYLAYPILKLSHELAHALALLRWKGHLGQVGILMMIFVPLPFVDASASHHFARRSQRIVVGSAGVMAELAFAAGGLLLWSHSAEGVWRDLGFNVAFIGAVSSLLFNGNPLMRFDGYYVLSDVLNIQNLNSRSYRYLGALFRRYVWRLDDVPTVAASGYEKAALGSYGVASFFYRFFVYYWICYYLITHFFLFGVLLSGLAFGLFFLKPVYSCVAAVYLESRKDNKLRRNGALALAIFAVVLWGVFGYQGSLGWALEGTVQLPPQSQVRARESGFSQAALLPHGTRVEAGQVLLELESLVLQAEHRIARSELGELRRLYQKALGQDRSESQKWQSRLDTKTRELEAVSERLGHLQVQAPGNGTFVHADLTSKAGRYIEQGDLVGYVLPPDLKLNIVVAVRQMAAEVTNLNNLQARIRFVSEPDRLYHARLIRSTSAATHELLDPALGSDQGGGVPVDISNDEHRAKERIFYFELELDEPYAWRFIPRMARVKLELPGVTLFEKWMIFWRDRLLTDFSWL